MERNANARPLRPSYRKVYTQWAHRSGHSPARLTTATEICRRIRYVPVRRWGDHQGKLQIQTRRPKISSFLDSKSQENRHVQRNLESAHECLGNGSCYSVGSPPQRIRQVHYGGLFVFRIDLLIHFIKILVILIDEGERFEDKACVGDKTWNDQSHSCRTPSLGRWTWRTKELAGQIQTLWQRGNLGKVV